MDLQGFAAQPAPVPYLNLEHGIRMDYPSSWLLREQGSPFGFTAYFGSPQESKDDQFQENLTILVQPLFAGATLDTVVRTWQAMVQNMPVQVRELRSSTLAGNTACRITVDGQLPVPIPLTGRSLIHMIVIGAKAYTVTYIGQDGHFDTFLPAVNQMLGSLQLR